MSDTITKERIFTSGVYAKRELAIIRGKGVTLWDDQGKTYIDCVSAHGAANLGHSHPAVVEAITQQAKILISCPEMYHNDIRAALLEKLIRLAPSNIKRAFLCNSGTEAVEAAIKFARFSTKRTEIISFMRGFHGRTLGSLSATWNKKYRAPFEPLVPEFKHVPYNNLEKLEAAISEETAAIILEVVQGEGGVHPGGSDFLLGAQRLCHEKGTLLIVDEVQTGFGRTGKMFAFQHHELQPDMICLAKSIAGGVPMGAVLIGDRIGEISPGIHGSTFGGNPLSCAAALAVLETFEKEKLCERAAQLGESLFSKVRAIKSPLIRDVRGMGLMVGIELKQKVSPYLNQLLSRGVLALPAGLTVIRLMPPLVITTEEIYQIVDAVEEVLSV
ncbi:MAG: aspartate aminotransferase family protein [Chloroflexi bacterium]|nr:aspartate aminotransferase family protein [Chloroflexota bacterium]